MSSDHFVAAPLTADHIEMAFPIVQTCDPAADIGVWRRYAEHKLSSGPETGIQGIFRDQYIYGLYGYYLPPAPKGSQRSMVVDMVVYADLFAPLAVAGCLLNEMNDMMQRFEAIEAHLNLPNPQLITVALPLLQQMNIAGININTNMILNQCIPAPDCVGERMGSPPKS